MSALNTDLYQLTMAAGYFAAGKADEVATFEISVRRLPDTRNFLLVAGLRQAVEYLTDLRFKPDEIAFIRSLAHFKNTPPEFFDYLATVRFTGDLYALPEGTPVFANEPIAVIRAPLAQAQLLETYLLTTFAFQTTVASKAIRCVLAAEGKQIVEFGSRRAHSPGAGILAARAAYISGCLGTSNAEAGKLFGIPLFGTAAHSWTMAFPNEEESFRALQRELGESTVFLIDTYDTLEGAHLAARIGRPLWGVRLDSGNLAMLSRKVRKILDDAGLHDAKIFATNDLNEHRVAELVRAGAPIDAFGIGTQLATSYDAPALSVVYKLVELRRDGELHYTAKYSDEKVTLPGAKQIYRQPDRDIVALVTECSEKHLGEPLLRPTIIAGELVEPLPSIEKTRDWVRKSVAALPSSLLSIDQPAPYRVEISAKLQEVAEQIRNHRQPVP
jgi:nicotinate phosphoribosyltransferase